MLRMRLLDPNLQDWAEEPHKRHFHRKHRGRSFAQKRAQDDRAYETLAVLVNSRDYSCLKALIGLIAVALRAGM